REGAVTATDADREVIAAKAGIRARQSWKNPSHHGENLSWWLFVDAVAEKLRLEAFTCEREETQAKGESAASIYWPDDRDSCILIVLDRFL
ncbi:MAG TPA: hypothetical protein VFM21_02090, partial [Terriglobia bacterium]|nr:hypothetical protein [Terriglobia bacterium]